MFFAENLSLLQELWVWKKLDGWILKFFEFWSKFFKKHMPQKTWVIVYIYISQKTLLLGWLTEVGCHSDKDNESKPDVESNSEVDNGDDNVDDGWNDVEDDVAE